MTEDDLENINNEGMSLSPSSDIHPAPRKLRKIKRPRIRPAENMPMTPPKIMPDAENTPSSIIASTVNTEIDESDTPQYTVENDGVTEPKNLTPTTDLMTIKDVQAKELQSQDTSGYVLDSLPPDLDDDGDGLNDFINEDEYIKKSIFYVSIALCFLIGIFIGKSLFATQTIEKHGLEGVVINQDVPAGRPRCGRTDKSQACVFYVMNWYKQELNGRDFYKLAAQLTNREEYMIETDNLLYANVKIKPGYIAQLNIPALK